MLKRYCQLMQPGEVIKTEHIVNPASLGATADFHSPLLKKKERDSLRRHLHGQQTHLVTSHITARETCWHQMKAKAFPDRPIKSDNCLVVDAREILNILAETAAFSRWESAYIVFMQTFPHLVCNHPFTAKQFSVIANSLDSC